MKIKTIKARVILCKMLQIELHALTTIQLHTVVSLVLTTYYVNTTFRFIINTFFNEKRIADRDQ